MFLFGLIEDATVVAKHFTDFQLHYSVTSRISCLCSKSVCEMLTLSTSFASVNMTNTI